MADFKKKYRALKAKYAEALEEIDRLKRAVPNVIQTRAAAVEKAVPNVIQTQATAVKKAVPKKKIAVRRMAVES